MRVCACECMRACVHVCARACALQAGSASSLPLEWLLTLSTKSLKNGLSTRDSGKPSPEVRRTQASSHSSLVAPRTQSPRVLCFLPADAVDAAVDDVARSRARFSVPCCDACLLRSSMSLITLATGPSFPSSALHPATPLLLSLRKCPLMRGAPPWNSCWHSLHLFRSCLCSLSGGITTTYSHSGPLSFMVTYSSIREGREGAGRGWLGVCCPFQATLPTKTPPSQNWHVISAL